MTPQGAVVIGPDESESELSDAGTRCDAVLVGIDSGGKMEAPAANGCHEPCLGEAAALLDEDAAVSDVPPPAEGGHVQVKLCTHSRQLYQARSYMRKCAHVTCFRRTSGAHGGVAYCNQHLEIHCGAAAAEATATGATSESRRKSGPPPAIQACRSHHRRPAVAAPAG